MNLKTPLPTPFDPVEGCSRKPTVRSLLKLSPPSKPMKNQTSSFAATLILLAVSAIQGLAQSTSEPYTFITVAGLAGNPGSADGTGSGARFSAPVGVAVDSAGNVYMADQGNHTIRKMTPAGVVTTLAGLAGSPGSADGIGDVARFNNPTGVAVDTEGNVYVADDGNNTIRKVTPTGTVTTLAGLAGSPGSADGTGSDARFGRFEDFYTEGRFYVTPTGVAVDGAGNVYLADTYNCTIRKVTPAGTVTTLAGLARLDANGFPLFGSTDGVGSAARFNNPSAVAVDSAGNVYVADTGNKTIRKVTPMGLVTTLAGLAGGSGSADGTGGAAEFGNYSAEVGGPNGVAVDSEGNVYATDQYNFTIRKVTPAGVVTTLAGLAGNPGSADGTGSDGRFGSGIYSGGPAGVAVDGAGNVYIGDRGNNTIRKGFSPVGSPLILIQPQCQTATATYGASFSVLAGGAPPLAYQWRKDGADLANATNASFSIASLQMGDDGGYSVLVSNLDGTSTSSNAVLTVTSPYTFTTLAGLAGIYGSTDGTGSAAQFGYPQGVAVDSAGNVYVADSGNNTIRKVTSDGVVTLAGLVQVDTNGNPVFGSADGTGSAAQFNQPSGVAVDGAGNVYVADLGNHTIRKVTPAGVVTTLAGRPGNSGSADGRGSAAQFDNPYGVAVDSAGNVYVADTWNCTIRKVTPTGGVTTLAGLAGSPGNADGTGSAAQFNQPSGVAVDGAGNVYVADTGNSTIRKVTPDGLVTTLASGLGSTSLAVDGAGNIYVAGGDHLIGSGTEMGESTIRKVTSAGQVTTLAGQPGIAGSTDGTGSNALFGQIFCGFMLCVYYGPSGVAVDGAGKVYVADTYNNTIRKGYPALMIINSGPGFGFSGGHFGFNLTGPAGQAVVVEASINLVDWLPIWTNTLGGTLNFSDPQSSAYSHRFYRARTP
jgi:sugar lactone lactonase YvrE